MSKYGESVRVPLMLMDGTLRENCCNDAGCWMRIRGNKEYDPRIHPEMPSSTSRLTQR